VTNFLTPQPVYDVKARRISGTHEEKLEQIDEAIQELIDIKTLECLSDRPNVQFLTVPRPRSHAVAMTVTILALLVVLVLLLGVRTSHAQATTAAAPASAWHAGGTFDVSFLDDTNDPANHLFRTRGTTPKVDELGVNMAAAYVKRAPTLASRWGIELTAQTGHDTDAFGFSPTAPNLAGADWLRRLGPVNASYLFDAGRGLTLQGGIFSSLIGYDSLYAKDNFTYTRPWGADFTPYLMLGGSVAYPFSNRLTVTGFVVNSYFHLSHPNDAPSFGGQAAYSLAPGVSLKQTVLYGSHQADTSLDHWRILSDTILERKSPRFTIAGELQLATELVAGTGERASWVSAQLPLHVILDGPWSVTFRPEAARDRSGRYTSVAQTIVAMTSTLEYRRRLSDLDTTFRFEYRFDDSRGPAGGFYSGPDNDLVPQQHLLIGAVILSFDRGIEKL
jgi:hypothetical protein